MRQLALCFDAPAPPADGAEIRYREPDAVLTAVAYPAERRLVITAKDGKPIGPIPQVFGERDWAAMLERRVL